MPHQLLSIQSIVSCVAVAIILNLKGIVHQNSWLIHLKTNFGLLRSKEKETKVEVKQVPLRSRLVQLTAV